MKWLNLFETDNVNYSQFCKDIFSALDCFDWGKSPEFKTLNGG
jgi:hypothetical protein